MVDKALRHGERALPDVERQQQFTLGGHGDPDPLRGTLQALDGFGRTALAVPDGAEQRKQLIQLHLPDPQVMQKVLREGPELLRCFDQPLQHRLRVDLEHPRGAPDAPALGQAGDDPHDEFDRGTLAMKERAKGFEKRAATGDAEQRPPGTAIGMAMGMEIAPSYPSPIGTIRVGAEMGGGVALAAAPPRGYDARRRG
jgi:hypothetical protein